MAFDPVQFVTEHPRASIFVAVTIVLAVIGLWYVIRHHLQLILITLLCAAGLLAGGLVIYRGWNDQILIGAGAFLVVIFPLIWIRAIGNIGRPESKSAPVPLAAAFDLEIKPKTRAAKEVGSSS